MPSPGQPNAAPLLTSIETILDDRFCSECGYSLKGLSASGLCPECGEPCAGGVLKGADGHRVIDNTEMGQASLLFLLPLGFALLICGLAGMVLTWFVFLIVASGVDTLQVRIGLVASTAWFLSILILLRVRPRSSAVSADHHDDSPGFIRLILALTQPAWIAAAALAHLELAGVAGAGTAKWPVIAIGVIGMPALPWHLSYTALWAMHIKLADWLRGAAWTLAFGGLLSGSIQTLWIMKMTWTQIFFVIELVGRFLWHGALIATSLFALQMVIDVRWAVINARERAARDRRIAERRRRYAESVPQATLVSAPPLPPEVVAALEDSATASEPAEPPPQAFQYRSRDEARIEPSKDVKPYGLEDEHDEPTGDAPRPTG
jgi:hypothetical protein